MFSCSCPPTKEFLGIIFIIFLTPLLDSSCRELPRSCISILFYISHYSILQNRFCSEHGASSQETAFFLKWVKPVGQIHFNLPLSKDDSASCEGILMMALTEPKYLCALGYLSQVGRPTGFPFGHHTAFNKPYIHVVQRSALIRPRFCATLTPQTNESTPSQAFSIFHLNA